MTSTNSDKRIAFCDVLFLSVDPPSAFAPGIHSCRLRSCVFYCCFACPLIC